ncbi:MULTISPECIES: hypothetical protein [Streptomyces]|uniref:Uncharacterized protein n=2 Tax=Streptomyces TaxID=1883 RepID=A0A8H9HVL5_9ACTN|nr:MULTISPECIES: hypothetical protein [Streptomyces]PJM82542.1 hypothetical protein CH313_18180 [Streptomyces sp. TSRI0384-2]GFH76223.1 hypothetical protein Sgou_08930 [Streptomyces gougerotii]GGU84256.1 hypothetical protein GCM10010227_43210 [Streptomyces gougerotii]SUP36980.1 Penicillin acylase [Streptomyces griseus]
MCDGSSPDTPHPLAGRAVAVTGTAVLTPRDAGDQWGGHGIVQRAVGGLTHEDIRWRNRPACRRMAEFPGHG